MLSRRHLNGSLHLQSCRVWRFNINMNYTLVTIPQLFIYVITRTFLSKTFSKNLKLCLITDLFIKCIVNASCWIMWK